MLLGDSFRMTTHLRRTEYRQAEELFENLASRPCAVQQNLAA